MKGHRRPRTLEEAASLVEEIARSIEMGDLSFELQLPIPTKAVSDSD